MRTPLLLVCLLLIGHLAFAQKKPLDPAVFDGWQRVAERTLSADGKYIAYTVLPSEGDGTLYIKATSGAYAKEIPRGAEAAFTADGRFLVFRIRPLFRADREARIQQASPNGMPKDTLAWIDLGTDNVVKIPRIRSFKFPDLDGDWVAWLADDPEAAAPAKAVPPVQADSLTRIRQLSATADSLTRLADSLRRQIREVGVNGWAVIHPPTAKNHPSREIVKEGAVLILRNLATGEQKQFSLVNKYYFNRYGNALVLETTRNNDDSASRARVIWYNTGSGRIDTVLTDFNDVRNYALDEAGSQLAFVAERDSAKSSTGKFYRLWYFTPGMHGAEVRVDISSIATTIIRAAGRLSYPYIPAYVSANSDQHSPGSVGRMTVSADFGNYFSKDGNRLFFGLAQIRPSKDKSLAQSETARLDVWNYKDEYLASEQLTRLSKELRRSWLAVLPKDSTSFVPLGDDVCETIQPDEKGSGLYAIGLSDKPYRIQEQWEESGVHDVYLVTIADGSRKMIKEKVRGDVSLSPGGKFLLWYERKKRAWCTYEIATGVRHILTAAIRVPLYDEEYDRPDDPPAHGTMGWLEHDKYVYVYDKYDIWQCDPTGNAPPVMLTGGLGRRHRLTFRKVALDEGNSAILPDQWVLLTVFSNRDKSEGFTFYRMGSVFPVDTALVPTQEYDYESFVKARDNWTLVWGQENFDKPLDLWLALAATGNSGLASPLRPGTQISHINPQQANYNWVTAELHHWKMLDGRMDEGLLYKPENFDSTKKYPVIFWFYERDADLLHHYWPAYLAAADLNLPYFVSNGYLIFDPNIYYKTGAPGESAYNAIISAVHYLSRFKWVDTTRIGLQGHSWGGYQVNYLLTRTHLFAAAEAGAGVTNMTSAYGGILRNSGASRQFLYEKSQSRIGFSLWQRPELYIKNSPLFGAEKVTTPLLIMHNDEDELVPWEQGVEWFTALRRLGKKAWLIDYNGEGHALDDRPNRRDWSIRLSQFFDYYLKGARPARWITEGVPAKLKGIEWGLETP